jgi:hypothetical protein
MKARGFVFASLAFLFAFFAGTAIAQSHQCSHVRGNWTDEFSYYWTLNQNGTNVWFSQVDLGWQDPPCVYQVWPVGGSTSSGAVSLSANNPASQDEVCVQWFDYHGTILRGGCRTISGTWNSSAEVYGTFTMTKACEVPDRETTDPTYREENWVGPATYDFIVYVNGPSSPDNNLSGRFYRETDYAPAIDQCWVAGDPPEFRVSALRR